MRETIDRVFYTLAGIRLSDLDEDSPEYGVKVESGDLAGVSVIAGIDRSGGALPTGAWPNVVIEAVSEVEQGLLFKTVTLALSVGVSVPGRFTALFGRKHGTPIVDLVRAVKIAIASNKTLNVAGSTWAGNGQIQSVDYGLGSDDNSNKVGKRYGNIVVSYIVPTETNITT